MDPSVQNDQDQTQPSLKTVLDNMIAIAGVITRLHDRNDKLTNAHFVEGIGLVTWTHVENDLQLDIRRQPELTDPVSIEIACTFEKAGEDWVLSAHDKSFTLNVPGVDGRQHAFADVGTNAEGRFAVNATYGLAPSGDELAAAADFSSKMLKGFEAHEAAI